MSGRRNILFVPGLGSNEGSETTRINCKVITFDYKHSNKAIIDFFADNYTFITTDRVSRLEDMITKLMNESESHELFVIAHSHGALLVHNVLKKLGKKYGNEYTKNVTVATFGPAKAIPLNHKNYLLKDATNVFFENDWILNRFKNKVFLKLQKDLSQEIEIKGRKFKILIKSVENDPFCTSGSSIKDQIEAHKCYFNNLINSKETEFCFN